MSRYIIPATNPEHLVVVGYDPPLETFFLQVDDRSRPDHADHLVCWLGTQPHEVPHVADLIAAVQPYAHLSGEVIEQLQQEDEQREPPTPLQRHMSMAQRARTMP